MKLFTKEYYKRRGPFITLIIFIIMIFALVYFLLDFGEDIKEGETTTTYFQYNSIPNDSIARKIFNKIYFSLTTLTTLGFGDIHPIHPISQALVAFQTFSIFILISELVR